MKEYNIKGKIISKAENIDLIIKWDNVSTSTYSNKFSCLFNNKYYESFGNGVFDTFIKLVDDLLVDDIGLDLKGALINAYQDELDSQSTKIYLVELYKKQKVLCDIFDYSNNEEFADSNDRIEFISKWKNSISRNSFKSISDLNNYKKKCIFRLCISLIFVLIFILLFYVYIYRRF